MPNPVFALAGGSVLSTGVGALSANAAAKAQTKAADQANETQRYIFDRNVELSEPWRETGQNALAQMSNELGLNGDVSSNFKETPGYQFRLEQGQNALERHQSARGVRYGGQAIKEAMRFGDGTASQEYSNYYNRLAALSGVGQNATSQQQQAGTNYANAVGSNTLAAGQARASGYQNMNNALQGGIQNGFQIYGMQQAGMFS